MSIKYFDALESLNNFSNNQTIEEINKKKEYTRKLKNSLIEAGANAAGFPEIITDHMKKNNNIILEGFSTYQTELVFFLYATASHGNEIYCLLVSSDNLNNKVNNFKSENYLKEGLTGNELTGYFKFNKNVFYQDSKIPQNTYYSKTVDSKTAVFYFSLERDDGIEEYYPFKATWAVLDKNKFILKSGEQTNNKEQAIPQNSNQPVQQTVYFKHDLEKLDDDFFKTKGNKVLVQSTREIYEVVDNTKTGIAALKLVGTSDFLGNDEFEKLEIEANEKDNNKPFRYNFENYFTGADISAYAYIVNSNIDPLPLDNIFAITVSTTIDTKPVMSMGRKYVTGYTHGNKIIAGTMMFYTTQTNPFYKIQSALASKQYYQYVSNLYESDFNIVGSNEYIEVAPELLPPFSILLLKKTEYDPSDIFACYMLEGVRITSTRLQNDIQNTSVSSYEYTSRNYKMFNVKANGTSEGDAIIKVMKQTNRDFRLSTSVVNKLRTKTASSISGDTNDE